MLMPARMYLGGNIWEGIELGDESLVAYDFSCQSTRSLEERSLHEVINDGDSDGLHEFRMPIQRGLVHPVTSDPERHFQ